MSEEVTVQADMPHGLRSGSAAAAEIAIEKIVDAGSLATVANVAGTGAMAAGEVAIISLDAIAAKLAHRWQTRGSLVCEHTQRVLQRRMGEAGYAQRISNTEFVVILAGAGRARTQSLCLSALREVLQHFLGEVNYGDAIVHEVAAIEGGAVFGRRLEPELIEEAEALSVQTRALKAAPDARWSPFVAADGQPVRVSCALEPLIHLRSHERIGYRVARRVVETETQRALGRDEEARMVTNDIERVDFATLARSIDRLRSEGGRQATLLLPISFATLSSRRARQPLIDLLKQGREVVARGVILEVRGIDGAPAAALSNACGELKPHCLFLVGHLEAAPTKPPRHLAGIGLQGLSIDCPVIEDEALFMAWTRRLVDQLQPVVRSTLVYELASLRHAAIAGVLGVTHGALRR